MTPDLDICSLIENLRKGEISTASAIGQIGFIVQEALQSIQKHVEEHKARYKWISGGIEFIDEIPKSPSGKILRRELVDRERTAS